MIILWDEMMNFIKAGIKKDIALVKGSEGGYFDFDAAIGDGYLRFVADFTKIYDLDPDTMSDIVRAYGIIVKKGGDLKLSGMNADLREAFEIIDNKKVLKIYEHSDIAIDAFDHEYHGLKYGMHDNGSYYVLRPFDIENGSELENMLVNIFPFEGKRYIIVDLSQYPINAIEPYVHTHTTNDNHLIRHKDITGIFYVINEVDNALRERGGLLIVSGIRKTMEEYDNLPDENKFIVFTKYLDALNFIKEHNKA